MMSTATRARSHRDAARVGQWTVSIRPIEAADAASLSAFYAALGDESRRLRFFAAVRGIDDRQARHFSAVDHRSADGLVAVHNEAGPDDGRLIGHLCLEPNGDGTSEVAVAVADDWQGRGVGHRLLQAGIVAARRSRIRSLTLALLHENTPMRRLMLGSGLPVVPRGLDGNVMGYQLLLSD